MTVPPDAIYTGPPADAFRCACGEIARYSSKRGVFCKPCGWEARTTTEAIGIVERMKAEGSK